MFSGFALFEYVESTLKERYTVCQESLRHRSFYTDDNAVILVAYKYWCSNCANFTLKFFISHTSCERVMVHICSLDECFFFYPIGRHAQQVIRKFHPHIMLSKSTKDDVSVYSRLLFSARLNNCLIIQINADLTDSLWSFTKYHRNDLKCAFPEVGHKYIPLPGREIHLKISGLLPNDGGQGRYLQCNRRSNLSPYQKKEQSHTP